MTIITIIIVITFRRGGRGQVDTYVFCYNLIEPNGYRMTIMSLKAVITFVIASSIFHLLYRTQH